MWENVKVILRELGKLLHVPAAMAVLSLIPCLVFQEYYAIIPLLVTTAAGLVLGQALFRTFHAAPEVRLGHGTVIAATGWIIVPIIGAIPYILIALHLRTQPDVSPTIAAFAQPLNALFESFSGFTGTGLTVAVRPSQLPHTLQWWRSFTEWVGGVGVIVVMLTIAAPDAGLFRLYFSEGRDEKIMPTVRSTVRTIGWIFLLFTVASILLLRVFGMSWWDALNHAMTGISTGGFSTRDESLAAFSPAIRGAIMIVMVLGAISFAAHYQVLRYGRLKAWVNDGQHRALWILLAIGSVAVALERAATTSGTSTLNSVFHWVSALTTCGFQSDDLSIWHPAAQLMLVTAMVIGGASGSTVGGIKLVRFVLLLKGTLWRFMRLRAKPHELLQFKLGGRVMSEIDAERQVEAAGVLALLWILVLGVGVFVLLHVVPEQFSLGDVLLEVASAEGNVGLSTGITSPGLHPLGKVLLIAIMWVGRLEIIPVFAMIGIIYERVLRR